MITEVVGAAVVTSAEAYHEAFLRPLPCEGKGTSMSNAVIRQSGTVSIVADNLWQFRLGAVPLGVGVVLGASLVALSRRERRSEAGEVTRPPTPAGWPVNFAHRGGKYVVPENTLEGFAMAREQFGDIVLELDVHACADGAVVVLHDDTVDRTTQGHGPVSALTLDQVKALDAAHHFTTDGSTFPYRGQGFRIPTLAEVLGRFPDAMVNVELKGGRAGFERTVWEAIEAAEAQSRTMVVATRGRSISAFRYACGGTVATGASTVELLTYRLLALVGATGAVEPAFAALQAPDRFRGVPITSRRFIRTAHDDGLRVDVWTVDDEADVRRLLGWDADGIMTDRPDVVARVLAGVPT